VLVEKGLFINETKDSSIKEDFFIEQYINWAKGTSPKI